MASTERIIDGLPDETQKLLQVYAKDVKTVFGEQLEGLLIYGSAVRGEYLPGRSNLNLLLVVNRADATTLKRYESVQKRWSNDGVITPLFLTEQEIRTYSTLFPLEFLEIQEYHRVLGGRDPFVGFHVDMGKVGDAVRHGLVGHVVRLRQRFAEANGANDAVPILLPLALTSTVPLLRGIQRLRGWPVLTQSDAVIKDVADRLQVDLQGFHDVLLLKRGIISPGPSEVPHLFDRYLVAATTLAEVMCR
jgi:hypothetical protein